MNFSSIIIAATCLLPLAFGFQSKPAPSKTFRGQTYIKRFAQNSTTEYTPKAQTDLNKWSEMVTVNEYPNVSDGDALATAANSVLENYKSHGAVVVRTSSIPRTDLRPAEHLIVVAFPTPKFIEAAFARFKLDGGKGYSIVFSHRIYGAKVGDTMSKWLKQNGQTIEKELMAMPVWR